MASRAGWEAGKMAKTIDVLGRLLFAWYVIETARYFWTGRFGIEVRHLEWSYAAPLMPWAVVASLRIAVAAAGVFVLIPLLWRGAWGGLAAGLLYWGLGYTTNPLHFLIPDSYLVSPGGGPTALAWVLGFAWAATALAILLAFFFLRRSIVGKRGADSAR